MQLQSDKSNRLEEIKTQFRAREGYYRLMNSPDYSQRSQRAMGFSTGTANSNSSTASHEKTCIKISLVTIADNDKTTNTRQSINSDPSNKQTTSQTHRRSKGARDMKICFNVGRELFVYNYDGVRTGPDASNPIYKRSYKGSSPTCHDFNQATATSGFICLLVGFSQGQVQLIDLNGSEETCKEFNVDRLIDRTRVTCIKWLPNSPSLFLVAHTSGHLYLYKDDLSCGSTAPSYQLYKQSEGVTVYTCKTKTTRNPLYKWTIGAQSTNVPSSSILGSSSSLNSTANESCSLNEFVFSPCAKYLACVSQDGFLRVYCYDTMELVGRARSYYGGLTCVCWSPDGKYVVTGGEDDLITVWSFVERRVVARGMGHKSWVSVVAFDSFYTGYDLRDTDVDDYDDEDEEGKEVYDGDLIVEDDDNDESRYVCDSTTNMDDPHSHSNRSNNLQTNLSPSSHSGNSTTMTSYRFGSIGQDTQLCLWDLNDDLLRQPIAKSRISSMGGAHSLSNLAETSSSVNVFDVNNLSNHTILKLSLNESKTDDPQETPSSKAGASTSSGFLSNKGGGFTKTFSLVGKRDKRNSSLRNADKSMTKGNINGLGGLPSRLVDDPTKLLGSPICPRMNEVPLLEPTVCKKISFERLTSLIFCQGGFITSCQDGYVFSWARPSRKSLRVSPGQSNEELRVIDVGTSSAV